MSFSILSDTATTSPVSCDSHSKTKYILITNGDSYVGHALAIFISDQLIRREGQLKKKNWRVRVLCEDKKKLKDLEKKGIEVKEVDYESQSMLREQMKDHIKTIICNPFSQKNRLIHRGKNLIDAAVHEKVERIMMISLMGCSSSEDKESPMGQFNMLEEYLRNCYKYGSWVVFRIPMIQQFIYFWSSMIENKSVIGMPLSESDMLPTVNIKDICECVCQAALSKKAIVWSQKQSGDNNDITSSSSSSNNEADDGRSVLLRTAFKKIFELSSATPMTLTSIAQTLSDALKEEGFDSDVEPAIVSEKQLESYLKFVSKEPAISKIESHLTAIFPDVVSRKCSSSNSGLFYNFKSIFISGDTAKPSHDLDDPNWYPSPSMFLTPFCIEVILDHFRIAHCPEVPMIPTNDVRDITGRNPIKLSYFFMKNRRQFRPEFK